MSLQFFLFSELSSFINHVVREREYVSSQNLRQLSLFWALFFKFPSWFQEYFQFIFIFILDDPVMESPNLLWSSCIQYPNNRKKFQFFECFPTRIPIWAIILTADFYKIKICSSVDLDPQFRIPVYNTSSAYFSYLVDCGFRTYSLMIKRENVVWREKLQLIFETELKFF